MPNPETSSPPSLNVERICDLEGWRRLELEWNELLQDSAADAVFLCWEWLDTWLEVYGDSGEWVILTARNERGQLLGVAPMMLDRGEGVPSRWVRRLTLLGQKADTASEYLDWILRRGSEVMVVEAFGGFIFSNLSRFWDVLQFDCMRADAESIPLIEAMFKRRNASFKVARLTSAPFVSLPPSWDVFLAESSRSFRQRWAKFLRESPVVVRFAGADLTVPEGMKIIRKLNESRWGDRRQSFLSERYVRFHDLVAPRLHEKGSLLMLFFEVNGEIVAGRYDFAYGGKGWCFQGGWLPEWAKVSIGKMMLAEAMRQCILMGAKEYDFLGGEASYKEGWSDGRRELVCLSSVNPSSWRGPIFSWLREIRQRYRNHKTAQKHNQPSQE